MAEYLEKFADLTVRAGANVQSGQTVVVVADIAHAEVVRAVVEHAYVAGARLVEVLWTDGPVQRSAVVHASVEALSANRRWAVERFAEWTDEGIAFIRLAGSPNPHLMDGLDPVKVAARPAEETAAQLRLLFAGESTTWTAVSAPNAGWATQVFGEPDLDRLWDVVAVAMRLDDPDPVAAWTARHETLDVRAKTLDSLALTELRYQAPGTDLTVGLLPETRWTGGGLFNPAGIFYLPNLPTEEVFTSPDRGRAEGRIALTKPLVLPGGVMVEGLTVVFEDGRIVDVAATRGADAVLAQLDTDEGARSLGEVSLVDRDSRIAKAGIIFHDTLFDENAGCHVAWGASFPFAVAGGSALSPADRRGLGLNTSAVHTDVVIGGNGTTVTATGPAGDVTIMRDDEWVLPLSQ
jgi:aminopeptidase